MLMTIEDRDQLEPEPRLPVEWRWKSNGPGGCLGAVVSVLVGGSFGLIGLVLLVSGLRHFALGALPQMLFGAFGCVLGVSALHTVFELDSPWECGWRIDHTSLRWHVLPIGLRAKERRSEAEPRKFFELEVQMVDVREVRDRKCVEIVMVDGSVHKLPREFSVPDDTPEIVRVIKAHFPHVAVGSGTSYPRVRYWRDKDR